MRFVRTSAGSALAAIVLIFGLAACASGGSAAPSGTGRSAASGSGSVLPAPSGSSSGSGSGSVIPAARCAQNRAAGQITYLSGYYFQASASILEYVAASKLGYFSDECLNVALVPGNGDTAQLAKLLASGRADIAALAEQDLIQARANGVDVEGVSSYSNAGLDVLMTNPGITRLTQLNGATVGDKGYFPAAVEAMLIKSGVTFSSLHVVKEGYDPTVLPRRASGLAALTGFVSNEPNQLRLNGDKVTVWQPVQYGIPSSLGAMAVNPAFAAAHPTAVQDILRAALHAYAYCSASAAHVAQCVGYAAARSGGTTYDTRLNTAVWNTETSVVKAHPTPGQPLGGIEPANVGAIVAMLHQFAIVGAGVTAAEAEGWFSDAYIKAIYRGDTLVWPAA